MFLLTFFMYLHRFILHIHTEGKSNYNIIRQWIKFSIFFSWIITNCQESVIRLLPRSVESGVTITTKQAASSKASSKSTRTVLLQIQVLAKELEVSENQGFSKMCNKDFNTRVLFIELLVCSASQKSLLGFSKPNKEFSNFAN